MTSKKDLSERDICRIYITPAITGGGWDGHTQIRENVYLTKGRVIVRGKLAKRSEKRKFADYVLYRGDTPIAIVEAKDNTQAVGAGMQQALEYAEMVDVPFVFSSNGDAFLFHDRTGRSTQPETELALERVVGKGRLRQGLAADRGPHLRRGSARSQARRSL